MPILGRQQNSTAIVKSISHSSKGILVVLTFALLAGIAIFAISRHKVAYHIVVPLRVDQQTAFRAGKSHLQQFDVALLIYRKRVGFYPTTEQGLKALTVQPATEPIPYKWSTLMMTLPKDPWGSDYIYKQPGQHNPDSYDVYSPGADRIPGSADDIGNWQ